MNKVILDLGDHQRFGFYHVPTDGTTRNKKFTEVREGKLPYDILNILKEHGKMSVSELNKKVLEKRPDLTLNSGGKSGALLMALKDFDAKGLIDGERHLAPSKRQPSITELGKKFFETNIIPKGTK